MSDEALRALERRAAAGDREAAQALGRARARAGAKVAPAAKPVSKLRKAQREALLAAIAAVDADDPARLEGLLPALVEQGVLDHPGAVAGTGPLLHHALIHRRDELARLLLIAGADIEAPDLRKRTPLMRAAHSEALVWLLLDLGADVRARDTYRGTALHFAAGGADLAVIGALLDQGADVNAADSSGRTPLHEAAACAYLAGVRLLLERGADPDARWGGERLTPLAQLELMVQDRSGRWGTVPPARAHEVEATLACLRAVTPGA